MIPYLVALTLAASSVDAAPVTAATPRADLRPAATAAIGSIECPVYPGDPPWRKYTCYILTHIGEPPTRPSPYNKERWEPVESAGHGAAIPSSPRRDLCIASP